MARVSVPDDDQDQVLLRSRRRCCICFGLHGDLRIKQGQIAHLDQNNANADPDNLAFLCLQHHDQYDGKTSQSKALRESEVKQFRAELYERIAAGLPIEPNPQRSEPNPHPEPCFSFETPEEIHSHVPLSLFIRNCSSRFARNIRFEPIESRFGLRLWFTGLANLAPQERKPLGFKVGEEGEYLGVVGHVVNFFEGGSSTTDQPPYTITIRFLDGRTERTEQHVIEGHPLPKGGVRLGIYPCLDEKQERKAAREEIGRVLQQLAQCEREAYNGSNALDYDKLLEQIQQVKQTIHSIATRYLDTSFESRFLAVNVLDVQLDNATKMHFISRAQGSFWTVYQQIKGWRACLVDVLRELGR